MRLPPSDIPAEDIASQPPGSLVVLRRLEGRLYLFGLLVAIEYIFCFPGRLSILPHWKIFGMVTDVYGQIPLFAYAVFLGFGYPRWRSLRKEIPFGRIFLVFHLLCLAAVLWIALAAWKSPAWQLFDPGGSIESVFYVLATLLLALACVPLEGWRTAIRSTDRLWLYALLAGVTGWFAGVPIKLLWNATSTAQSGVMQRITLESVSAVLGVFLHNLIVDPSSFTIGVPRYLTVIAAGCSGIEGLGLVLIFTSFWLWYTRAECRFPQALLLIPCALGCSWLLNIARLSLLILIMNAGAPYVVGDGFHAVAGWVAFIVIALAFSRATVKLRWLRKAPAVAAGSAGGFSAYAGADAPAYRSQERGESPAVRAYLIPFLAILAVGFVSRAATGGVDWFYPMRLVAAAAALWYFRAELKNLDWRCGWMAPLTGAAIFMLWIAPSAIGHFLWAHPFAPSTTGAALDALRPALRWGWIAIRLAGAAITVPIAEELAFRGYLARRLMSREFDRVPFARLTAPAILLSSVIFGLEHMKDLTDWPHLAVGALAGVAFAGVLRWRGRMGDAVVAHAVSNLLLAAWVLTTGDWVQW
ncbi:MAG: exosortase E/protease, VPEID-CTERM system [Terracidiphilus sp.]